MTDAELIRATKKAAGLSTRKLAKRLLRNPSTVWSWLRGDHRMPDVVREECERIVRAGNGRV